MIGIKVSGIGTFIRQARDQYVIKPLSRNRHIRKAFLSGVGASAIVLERSDHKIAVPHSTDQIVRDILRTGDYHRQELLNAISSLDLRGSIFLDLGANIGTQTIYAMKTGAFDKAIAIEPDPENFSLLKLNMFLNDFEDRVVLKDIAVSDSPGAARLWRSPYIGGHSIIDKWSGEAEFVDVRKDSVDTILNENGISPADVGMISLDVEGHEPEVIKGMSSLLQAKVPIMIEINPRADADFTNMIGLLKSSYNRFLRLTGPNLQKFSTPTVPEPVAQLSTDSQMDVLFL